MKVKEEQLLAHLKTNCAGKKNLQTRAQLVRALRVSENELQRLIHGLRVQGVPIASSRDGCFYAVDAGEVFSTIRGLERMVRGLNQSINGLTGALDGFTEPLDRDTGGDGP